MRFDRRTLLRSTVAAGATAVCPWQQSGAANAAPVASPVAGLPPDEDGYELWLRYRPVADPQLLASYRAATAAVIVLASDTVAPSIGNELDRACKEMLDKAPAVAKTISVDGTILIGTPRTSKSIHDAIDPKQMAGLGDEGFIVKSATVDGHRCTLIAANSDHRLLYGTFRFIEQMQLRHPIDTLDFHDAPRANIRVVDHWDDMDRTVTRGYAGLSIFQFSDLTASNPRYTDYARLLASIGINGTVINNVNASSDFLDPGMFPGYASLAGILRQWGIKLFLSINFAAPIDLTARDANPIATADPFDKNVQNWWAGTIDALYKAVPDFGGFLVKANSEGEPGPLTYNRTHADGANMFARLLAPHGGILIWRSFVHKGFKGWSEFEYQTFHALDGQFDSNVIVQTKNGPIDFQAREPTNPLFGAMPKTNQAIELQITQEYTGHATHLCYLPTYWSKVLGFETHYSGNGPTVGEIVDGSADKQTLTGFAGVINFGDDRNWTGSYLSAANTHGFGRLAWDHTLAVQDIAAEWTKLTFGDDPQILATLVPMLESSWQTYLNYTTPFGTGYMMRPTGAHYLPYPRGTEHLSHFTDSQGSGFDRTLATGSGFTRLYSDYWFDQYEHIDSCPEDLLMFMHIVPWERKLSNGKTVIQQIYDDHFSGVDQVAAMQNAWLGLQGKIDSHRFTAIAHQFGRQAFQSRTWRDVLVSYYFDNARIVSASNPWVQLEMKTSPMLLFGGKGNDFAVQLTNATADSQKLTLAIDQAHAGWSSTTADAAPKARESVEVRLSITPPIEPSLGAVGFIHDPAHLHTVGFGTQIMMVTPDAGQCTLALDIGTRPDSVVSGYTSLRAADSWSDSANAGWVGKPPRDTWLGDNWGLLQNHCASGGAPHILRLRIPAGKQRAWVLVGGQGTGTQPIRIVVDKKTLVETAYLEESAFQWDGFTLDGGKNGSVVDLTIEGADGRQWRLCALVVLKPGL